MCALWMHLRLLVFACCQGGGKVTVMQYRERVRVPQVEECDYLPSRNKPLREFGCSVAIDLFFQFQAEGGVLFFLMFVLCNRRALRTLTS